MLLSRGTTPTAPRLPPASWPGLGGLLDTVGTSLLGISCLFPFAVSFLLRPKRTVFYVCLFFFFAQAPTVLVTCLQEKIRGIGIRREELGGILG